MKKLPWRIVLYVVVIGYMFIDLRVCHGPLRDALRSRRDNAVVEAQERGWVALVNLEPITKEQVDVATKRYLYQRGLDSSAMPEKNLALIRRAVLQFLIDDTLVRQHASGDKFVAPDAETAAFVDAWKAGFSDRGDLRVRAEAQGWTEEAVAAELSQIWSRKRWLENRIAPGIEVSEDEVREWFDENRIDEKGEIRDGFYEPEKLLLSLTRHDDETSARATYDAADAKKTSDSETTWMTREDLPPELAKAVFDRTHTEEVERLAPIPVAGVWYLVEIYGYRAKRDLSYEEISPEIRSHLRAQRTESTVKELMEKLRKVANMHIFSKNL